jgi:hypothetical protein
MFILLGKSSGLIPLASNLGIGIWYSGLCGGWCCPSCWTAWREEDSWRDFFPTFLGLMGCPLQAGALKWFHQVTGLWAVFDSFSPQGRLQLGPEVSHCQFVQGGQIWCCLHQVGAAFPTAATLYGQLLPQQGGAIQFWVPPQSHETSSEIHHGPSWGGWLVAPPPLSVLVASPNSAHC